MLRVYTAAFVSHSIVACVSSFCMLAFNFSGHHHMIILVITAKCYLLNTSVSNDKQCLDFFYLQKTRKVLTEKIAQLNSAIDDVSAQLRSEDSPNGVAVDDEIEAAV